MLCSILPKQQQKKIIILTISWREDAQARECVSKGTAGAQTRRSLGHRLLHPLIMRPRALFDRTDCTRRSKFLTHTLQSFWIILLSPNICWEITNTIQHWRLGIFDQITKRCNFMHEIFRMFFRQVYNLFPIRCAVGQEIRDHMCLSLWRQKKNPSLFDFFSEILDYNSSF